MSTRSPYLRFGLVIAAGLAVGVPGRVYERKTGQRMPYRSDGKIALSGRPWRSDDEVRERFPELYGKYLGGK